MGSGYKAHYAHKADKTPDDGVRPGSYKSDKAHKTLKTALLWLLRAFLRLCRYAVLHA